MRCRSCIPRPSSITARNASPIATTARDNKASSTIVGDNCKITIRTRLDAVAPRRAHGSIRRPVFAFEMEAQRKLMHMHESAIGAGALHSSPWRTDRHALRQRRHRMRTRHMRSSLRSVPPSPRAANWRPLPVRCRDRQEASAAHLYVNGTATVASLAASTQDKRPDHAGLQVATIRSR